MSNHVADRLTDACREKKSVAVIGIDPRLRQLPPECAVKVSDGPQMLGEGLAKFCIGMIEAVKDVVPAVKPNIAFFEALGMPGLMVYGSVCAYARANGLFVIGDVKRGDIGSTAAAYAQGLMHPGYATLEEYDRDLLQPFVGPHDALTLNPYLGSDSLNPFLEKGRIDEIGTYILVKTSNPSSAELQDLALAEGGTVAERVAKLVHDLGKDHCGECGLSDTGAVVGATHPDELATYRELMPCAPLLVPGYGAQGGAADDVVGAFREDGTGALVNASRSVIFAWQKDETPDDWMGAARRAALAMNDDLRGALERAGKWSW